MVKTGIWLDILRTVLEGVAREARRRTRGDLVSGVHKTREVARADESMGEFDFTVEEENLQRKARRYILDCRPAKASVRTSDRNPA